MPEGGQAGEVRVKVAVDTGGIAPGMAQAEQQVKSGAEKIAASTSDSMSSVGNSLKNSVAGFHNLRVGIMRVIGTVSGFAGIIGLAGVAITGLLGLIGQLMTSAQRSRDSFHALSDAIDKAFADRKSGIEGELAGLEDQFDSVLGKIRNDKTMNGSDRQAAFDRAREQYRLARERAVQRELSAIREREERDRDRKSQDRMRAERSMMDEVADQFKIEDKEDRTIAFEMGDSMAEDFKELSKSLAELSETVKDATEAMRGQQSEFLNSLLGSMSTDLRELRSITQLRSPRR